ncbi:MAG: SPOR domain-containing protein [bacterium]
MSRRTDLIRQKEETRTKARSRLWWLLPGFLVILLAAGFFVREKLVAWDSVQELESQVKQANAGDQFTFFYTLPAVRKADTGVNRRHRSPNRSARNQQVKKAENQAKAKSQGEGIPRAREKDQAEDLPAQYSCGRGGGEEYTVQVAALRMQDDAEKIIHDLRARGYSAYMAKYDDQKSRELPWYRVRVGRFSGRSEAERHLKELDEKVGLKGFVIASTKDNQGF